MSRGFSKSEILEGSLGDLEDPVSISRLFVVDQSSPVKKKLRLITNYKPTNCFCSVEERVKLEDSRTQIDMT